jgi:lysine-N-methylase
VTIKQGGSNAMYASIQSTGGRCAFLADGLCSIQERLGEDYVGHTCATYPRISNTFSNHRERSLDLSCPEAARLALLDPKPMQFGDAFTVQGSNTGVRKLIIELLQNRDYPVSKRLILVGRVCDEWSKLQASSASEEARTLFLELFALAVENKLYDADLQQCLTDPATQLATALELMVARLRLDYTSPRYMDLYRDFADGLQLKTDATREERGSLYAEVYRRDYAPFMEQHDYVLENYLAAYAFKTMFPFGSPSVIRVLNLQKAGGAPLAQYMLMASYFSISKTVMIGLAGKHKSGFSAEHVVRSIQSISKTLEHCETYAPRLLEILTSKGIRDAAGMAVLIQN